MLRRAGRHPGSPAEGARRARATDSSFLRVTVLDDSLARRLLIGAAKAPAALKGLSLGPVPVVVRAIYLDPRTHPHARYEAYDALMPRSQEGPAPRGVRMRFTTPTALRVHAANLPLPEPVGLFRGYWHRWNEFAPEPAPESVLRAIEEGGVVLLSRHHIQTAPVRLSTSSQIGFVGEVSFEFATPDQAIAGWLTSLARFAFYAGSGYKSTMGMGMTIPYVAGTAGPA